MIDDNLVKRPTVIKKPHNKERTLTVEASKPALFENKSMSVFSIIEFNSAVFLMKLIPFQIKMIPNTTLKMVSHEGRMAFDCVG